MSDVYKLDEGSLATLDAETGHAAHPAMTLRLFTNNVVVDGTQDHTSFTEATFTGYAPIVMPDPGASGIAAHVAAIAYAEQSFTITAGAQNVYGWYMTNAAGTKAYWAQTDAGAPVAMAAAGLNNLRYTLTLKEKDSHF
jgi:hypothetical protein